MVGGTDPRPLGDRSVCQYKKQEFLELLFSPLSVISFLGWSFIGLSTICV